MRVRYSKRATEDLVAIAEYISVRSPSAAISVEDAIRSVAIQLSIFPFSGRETSDPDIRVLSTPRYPYLVFYEVLKNKVVIHHIRHGRRKPIS